MNESKLERRVDAKRPDVELEWNEPARFNALGIAETWSVTVEAEGKRVLSIGDQYVAGLDTKELEPFSATIRSCAMHLLGFIGANPVIAPTADAAAPFADMSDKATTPPLTGAELDKLEALARAATPGEWQREDRTIYVLEHDGWRKGVEQFRNRFSCSVSRDGSSIPQDELQANADFIAAANPATVLSLIAQARAQQAGAAPSAREMAIAQTVRRACVECYSPDDLAADWGEKMGDLDLSSTIRTVGHAPEAAHADDLLGLQRWSKEAEMMESWAAHAQEDAASAAWRWISKRDFDWLERNKPDTDANPAIPLYRTGGDTRIPLYLAPSAVAPSDAKGKADAANAGGQADLDAALRQEVITMYQLLDDGEWAEHIAGTPHGQCLETAITKLVGKVNQSATSAADAKDAEMWRFIVRDGRSFGGKFTLVVCEGWELRELHGREYEPMVRAAIAATQQAAPVANGESDGKTCHRCDEDGLIWGGTHQDSDSNYFNPCPDCCGFDPDDEDEQSHSSAKGGDAVGGVA